MHVCSSGFLSGGHWKLSPKALTFPFEKVINPPADFIKCSLVFLNCSCLLPLYDFNILNFRTCFMNKHVIYPGEFSMCIWEECIFCWWWVESYDYICMVHLVYGLQFLSWFSVWMFYLALDWSYLIPITFYLV